MRTARRRRREASSVDQALAGCGLLVAQPSFSEQFDVVRGGRTREAHSTVTTSAVPHLAEATEGRARSPLVGLPPRSSISWIIFLIHEMAISRLINFEGSFLRSPPEQTRSQTRVAGRASPPASGERSVPHLESCWHTRKSRATPLPARRAAPVRGASGPGNPAGRCRARRGSPASGIRARHPAGRSARARRTSPIRTRSPGAAAAGGS